MQAPNIIQQLYLRIDQWKGDKTMEHPSGIWGREPALECLRSLIRPGNAVIDLGCGAGYPTLRMVPMVGPRGHVIGIDRNRAMIREARKYDVEGLRFIQMDIVRPMPIQNASADVMTSFMVLPDLMLHEVIGMLMNVRRILRPGGKAVFLTAHPRAMESDHWDMDFMRYDVLEGVGTTRHCRESMEMAIEVAELRLCASEDLWIDKFTAELRFGQGSFRKLPTTPTFWLFTLEK